MNGFILAAGFGKRMGDLTANTPKPLLPFHGRPLIDYSLFLLGRAGVKNCFINLHYLGEQIESHLVDFPHFEIHFSYETEILGTAGGLRTALKRFADPSERLLLTNPDTIFFPSHNDLEILESFAETTMLFMTPRPDGSTERGFLFSEGEPVGEPGLIRNAHESATHFYNGLSSLDPRDYFHIPPDEVSELGPEWVRMSEESRLFGAVYTGSLLDLGTRNAYEKSLTETLPPSFPVKEWEQFIKGWG